MNKKKIEDKFSMDMGNYISGKENLNIEDEEYKELLELGKTLSQNDFSKNNNKERIFNKSLDNINKNKEEYNVTKSKRVIIKAASFALICILGITTMRTSFAQELVGKIADFISIRHVTVYEDPVYNEGEIIPVPEELKGKIFDKDGKSIEEIAIGSQKTMYTMNGEKINGIESESFMIVTEAESELKNNNLVVEDRDKLNDYTCFEVILPNYLPAGYDFDRAQFFRDENGIVENSKYISLYFTNDETGEYIYMQQRFADEETAYEAGGQKVEQLKINGADTILYDNNLDWEYNGIIYALSGRGIIPGDELIKIAESF